MTDRFELMRLDEVEGYAEEGRPRWHMIRSVLGIESFGINAWRATEAGQQIIGEHDELGSGAGGHEELYFVLSGRATFTVDSFPGQVFTGEIVQIRKAPQVVQNVVTYDVVVSAQNTDQKLLPGMTANVRIVTDRKEDALRVPNAALRFRPAGVEVDRTPRSGSGPGGGPGSDCLTA